ncbi:hypothetical protein BU24DRAFT_358086 [Aaosphaeria arxii CBS 175.79]|uniref:Pheromone-regulated membrane protein n=1 Tax=Aaosphaeria arxii CBS 175.79 TaxID=1450172 RepID=A0A6A5X9W7_9PLEO|nr:uncharacterized protein BU24DRAFT_358086 [Aaosphaeria arxii CBS 175.79]KAF2009544.1 hypothetical protein BU24DRAFT_358086 [Aaosphaeria arxii CBS 175.79]
MGCGGDREKGLTVAEEQKWDYIQLQTLSDFKSTSCLTPLSYVWLWILILVSVAVYAADAFTAINLLAFNKWSSQVRPKVSFDVAKWIFAICIIISYVFLIYRWIRAVRVIRSGSVTECYLEPLAAIMQSMRMGKNGQGWRRFLVFAELTKSRKGVDYIALFVYFQFKGALIIILAQGPRIAINALTLWAVMEAQIIPTGDHAAPKDRSPVIQFFVNIETIINEGNKQETVIYFTMLFSLVIWVIAFLSLFLSLIFYVFFLWHYVPSSDGTLTNYCRRIIESRLELIVNKKVKKALEKQDQKRRKDEQRAIKKGDLDAPSLRAPTLPKLGGPDDDTASVFSMSTTTTLPPYAPNGPTRSNTMSSSNTVGTARSMQKPTLPSLNERPIPGRNDTDTSYASNAPLLTQAESMGMASPIPPLPPLDQNGDYMNSRPMPGGLPSRPYSPMTQGRGSPAPRQPRSALPPVNTSYGNGPMSPQNGPGRVLSPNQAYPPRGHGPSGLGDPTFSPYEGRGQAMGAEYELSPVDMTPSDYMAPQLPNALRPGSPAMSTSSVGSAVPPRVGTAGPPNARPGLPASLQSAIQRREASQPIPNRGPNGYVGQQRSATAPIPPQGYGQGPAPRSNTTTPGAGPRGYNNQYGGNGW